MSDTIMILNCPACGEQMQKVYLETEGFFVDACLNGCGGIWLDNRELKKVDEKSEDIKEIIEAFKDKTFKKTDDTAERKCPICERKMVKNCVSAIQELTIDECYSCGGKFFDYKELVQMRDQYNSDEIRTQDILTLAADSQAMEEILNKLLDKENFAD